MTYVYEGSMCIGYMDGRLSISAHTDGLIYIKNRTGVSRSITYRLDTASF